MSMRPVVLAAVGGSGRGTRTVEAAARLARALDAPWHALFVETPRSARDAGIGERAAEALAHAVRLGATVSREPAVSVAEGLIAHLASAPAEHLVVGVPRRLRRARLGWAVRSWRMCWHAAPT